MELVRVLIVEDNEQNMELASFLLEDEGFEVHKATSLAEARELLRRVTPRLILLDMSLGNEDGLALVGELRIQGSAVRILALTAHAMRGDRQRFLDGGCDGYISKPINVKTFADEVRKHLEPAP
jgi:two-component system cell cycle response regulator DivK